MDLVRTTASLAGIALLVSLAACGGSAPSTDTTSDDNTNKTSDGSNRWASQDIPSYTEVDESQIAKPAADEAWSLDMGAGSAMAVAELEGESVLLSATRKGKVEIFNTDGDSLGDYSVHDNAITQLHTTEVDGEAIGVSVEVGLAKVFKLADGEVIDDIDLGSNYDFTRVVEYQDKPVFVNGGKEIVMTDLSSMDTLQHYKYDLGMSASRGDVVDVDGDTVLVADNVVGSEYGVGAWNLDDGSEFHSYPMYEHATESVMTMASGYLDDTVLVATGDHGGEIQAWDVTANEEYGPSVNPDNSSVTALTVVELAGKLVGIAGTLDRSLIIWDIESGESIEELESPSTGLNHLIITELDDRPAVFAGGDGWAMPYWLG